MKNMANQHALLMLIVVPHNDHQKSCYTLVIVINKPDKDLPEIQKMLETHYRHSELIQHLICEHYKPSLYNQALIKDLHTLMQKCEKVEVSFHLPNTNLKPTIDQKIAQLQKDMIFHVCESTFCLN